MKRKEEFRPRGMAGLVTALAWVFVLLCQTSARGQEKASDPAKSTPRYSPAPNPQRVFRLESEGDLIERMVRGSKTGKPMWDAVDQPGSAGEPVASVFLR